MRKSLRKFLGSLSVFSALLVVLALVAPSAFSALSAPFNTGLAEEEENAVPIVGTPCEGCEAVWVGMPETLTAHTALAPDDEPGQPLTVTGQITHHDGSPAPGTILYAYQTDRRGIYPANDYPAGSFARRHGRLRGWVEADAAGRYTFSTIRPAGYPSTNVSQHIHLHVIEPGRCTYYISEIVFDDDPRLTAAERHAASKGRGGNGLVVPEPKGDGWLVRRDVRLGLGIPGYERCSRTD